jgi:2-dehydro-3-deoxygluconokinase
MQSPRFDATFGGGEANVAVSLAIFGEKAAFASKFPKNPIGEAALGDLRRFGVNVATVARGGSRMGIYYCERGASQRASKVVYDRAHSSIAEATAPDFDWKAIFGGQGDGVKAEWFHFTGITPALSDSCAELCLAACKEAKAAGVKVSCDLNYRKNLWSTEKAGKIMAGLMPYVDVLIANEEDADKVFGIKAPDSAVSSGQLSHEGYSAVAAELVKRFGVKQVAITLRESHSASDNGWGAMLYSDGKSYFSKKYEIHIVDRVGGGDSFGAGLIYSMLNGAKPQDTLEFAVAASCLKHSVEGDFNLVTLDEVKALAGGDASGRVSR